MQSLKTLSTQLAIVLALATQAPLIGQDLEDLTLGQSYFKMNKSFTLGRLEAGYECEPNVLSEADRPIFRNLFTGNLRGNSDAFSLKIHDELKLLMAASSFKNFASLTSSFQLPPSLDLAKSDLLIARWDDSFLFTGLATTAPKTEPEFCGYYLELIWASNEFQLRLYVLSQRGRCCFLKRGILINTIPLRANLSNLNLVLVPKATQGQFQFQVTISKAGKISLEADPHVPLLSDEIWATADGLTPTEYRSINDLQLFIAVSKSAVEVKRARCAYPSKARTDGPSLKPVSVSDRLGNSFEPTQKKRWRTVHVTRRCFS